MPNVSSTSPIVSSPMLVQPISGSIASASALATILTAKYADGLPLYRMESYWSAARSNWVAAPWAAV